MSIQTEFLIYSIIWVLAFVTYIIFMKKSKNNTMGLIYIYFINFSVVHFWGSVFFISPSYWDKNLEITLLGFKYSTIAIVCFLTGSLIFYRIFQRGDAEAQRRRERIIIVLATCPPPRLRVEK